MSFQLDLSPDAQGRLLDYHKHRLAELQAKIATIEREMAETSDPGLRMRYTARITKLRNEIKRIKV